MIHQYKLNGYNIVLDTCSGGIHVVDDVAYDIISLFETEEKNTVIAKMTEKYVGIDGITPDKLHIKELIDRIPKDDVKEVIIATNPSVEGESTALLLQKLLVEKYEDLKVTRLARGLPLGVDISYADQITISAALENRTKL